MNYDKVISFCLFFSAGKSHVVNMSRIHKEFEDDKIFFLKLSIHWKKISPALYLGFTSLYCSRQCYWKNSRKQYWSKECLQWRWTVNDTYCLLRKKVAPASESLKVALSLWVWLMDTSFFFKDVMPTLILNSKMEDNFTFTVHKISEREDRTHSFINKCKFWELFI